VQKERPLDHILKVWTFCWFFFSFSFSLDPYVPYSRTSPPYRPLLILLLLLLLLWLFPYTFLLYVYHVYSLSKATIWYSGNGFSWLTFMDIIQGMLRSTGLSKCSSLQIQKVFHHKSLIFHIFLSSTAIWVISVYFIKILFTCMWYRYDVVYLYVMWLWCCVLECDVAVMLCAWMWCDCDVVGLYVMWLWCCVFVCDVAVMFWSVHFQITPIMTLVCTIHRHVFICLRSWMWLCSLLLSDVRYDGSVITDLYYCSMLVRWCKM
jgi:hypothetical protein